MEFLKEWKNNQIRKALPGKDFYKLIIAAVIIGALMVIFNLPESDYVIYDGAVDEKTGVVGLSGEYNGMSVLYMYTQDGEVIGEFSLHEKGTRAQFNRIYSEDGSFKFYYHHQRKLYTIDVEGRIIDEETLSSNDYWERISAWSGWKSSDGKMVYSCNKTKYIYDDSNYFSLKFGKGDRNFSIEGPDDEIKKLWTSDMRDADRQFDSFVEP